MLDDFQPEVFAGILDQTKDDELRVVADQIKREAAAGRLIDEALTEAQYALGLSFHDAKRVEAMVREAVAPPGREEQVRELKKNKSVDNPYAVAWESYNKGKEPRKEGADGAPGSAPDALAEAVDYFLTEFFRDDRTRFDVERAAENLRSAYEASKGSKSPSPMQGTEPRKEGASLTSMLDPDDPVDMAIMDFLNMAADAGVVSGEPGDLGSALQMLKGRAEELLRLSDSNSPSPLPGDMPGGREPLEGLAAKAGLRQTLRRLRRQLNSHDAEDVEGMSKLITCIEGVERQLEQKQKAKEDRAKARSEKADGEKQAEAAPAPAPAEPGAAPDDPSKPPQLPKPPAPLPSGEQMAEHAIDLASRMGEFKKKMAQLETDLKAALQVPQAEQTFLREKPLLIEFLRNLPDHRILMERMEKQWSILLVEQGEPSVDKSGILDAVEQRLAEAVKRGEQFAGELQRAISGMKANEKYQRMPAPSVKVGPTPAPLRKDPHIPAPSEKRSSLRITAGLLDSLISGFENAVAEIQDLLAVAQDKLQTQAA